MSYSAFEVAAQTGQPVELYEFTIGLTKYYYTSAEDTISYSGQDYVARAIDRTSPTVSSSENGRQQMEVTLPGDDVIAQRYIGIVPAETVHLRIIRFHRGDAPNGAVIWSGRVVSAKFEQQGVLCRLFSVSSESAISRPTPGRKFQSLCNHALYDGRCQVVKDDFKHTDEVLTVSGRDLTINGLGTLGTDWALGGSVVFDGVPRLIVAQSGNVITVQVEFESSPLGQVVDVYAGCDHSAATCASKFDNIVNFGGFPYVPTKNPFETGLD